MTEITGRYLDEWHTKIVPEELAAEPVAPIGGWRFVASNGSDSTGTGSIVAPFATLPAAIASITDASINKRYNVILTDSATLDAALVLPPNIFIIGGGVEQTTLTAPDVQLSAAWEAEEFEANGGFSDIALQTPIHGVTTTIPLHLYLTNVSSWQNVTLTGAENSFVKCSGVHQGVGNWQFQNVALDSRNSYYSTANIQGDNDSLYISSNGDLFSSLILSRTPVTGPGVNIDLGDSRILGGSISGRWNVSAAFGSAGPTLTNGAVLTTRAQVRTVGATTDTCQWRSGIGTPEGFVVGRVGDLWTRTDGGASTTLYVKQTGNNTNTGWTAK